jgi:hypothetical protein
MVPFSPVNAGQQNVKLRPIILQPTAEFPSLLIAVIHVSWDSKFQIRPPNQMLLFLFQVDSLEE